MKKNYTIKLKCESKELMESMMDVMLMSKGQLANHLTQALSAKGFESDIKIKVQGNELTITQKSGDKGTVFVTAGLSINTVKYSELVAPCKYLVIKDGSVTLYVKRETGDVFTHKHYKIITRSGIEKIQKAAHISIKYELWYADASTVTLKAIGTKTFADGTTDVIETLASASSSTSSNAYYAEMAEKRAMSRIVLKLAGLYEYGVFGADEAKEFEDATNTNKRAVYKSE